MALFSFNCPQCGLEVEADSTMSGGTAQCPKCNNSILVPHPGIEPGIEVAGFVVESRLGVGGMGEVWLARQTAMDRKVALKILSPALTSDKEFVTRFLQEVKMAGKLVHPNIVTAFDAGVDKNIYYLAVSYVDGVELGNRLRIDRFIQEREALNIILSIAKALKYAWDKFKILHRDIKPSNIMIDNDGVPKLMDMGISKSLAEDSQLTMTGMIMGTPYYMSPEQAKGDANLDFRADLYSLGATLYHLVTGERPYEATTAMGILTKHITEPFPPPQDRNPGVTDQCAALLEIMMAKDKNDRQQSWDDLINDIDLVLAGRYPRTMRPEPGGSTVVTKRDRLQSGNWQSAQSPAKPKKPLPLDKILIAFAAILCVIFGGIIYMARSGYKEPEPPSESSLKNKSLPQNDSRPSDGGNNDYRPERPPSRLITSSPPAEKGKEDPHSLKPVAPPEKVPADDQKVWEKIRAYTSAHQDEFQNLINYINMQKIKLQDPAILVKVDKKLVELHEASEKAKKSVMRELEKRTSPLIKNKQYAEAAREYREYREKYAFLTASDRKNKAEELLEKAESLETAKHHAEEERRLKHDKLMNRIADSILKGNFRNAYQLAEAAKPKEISPETMKMLEPLGNIHQTIRKSFASDVGKPVVIYTLKGKETVRIVEKNSKLYFELRLGKAGDKGTILKRISPNMLSMREKIHRIGDVNRGSGAILATYYAVHIRKYRIAEKYIAETGPLKEYLKNQLFAVQVGKVEANARNELINLFNKVGIRNPELPPDKISSKFSRMRLSIKRAKHLRSELEDYKRKYMKTNYAREHYSAIDELKGLIDRSCHPLTILDNKLAYKIKDARRRAGTVTRGQYGANGQHGMFNAVKNLRNGSVLEVIPADFRPENANVRSHIYNISGLSNLTIEGNGKFVWHPMVFKLNDCHNVVIRGLNGMICIESSNTDLTIVDSTLTMVGSRTNNANILLYNCRIRELVGAGGNTTAIHCLLRTIKYLFAQNVLIRNSMIIGKITGAGNTNDTIRECFRFTKTDNVKIKLANCLVYSEGDYGILVKDQQGLWGNFPLETEETFKSIKAMRQYVSADHCIISRPKFRDAPQRDYRLASDSPGKNAASDGHDIGANLGGNGLPHPF